MVQTRVLIVDDDPLIRKFIHANLKCRNYEVFLAENGQQALELLQRQNVELVLLDIMMPVLDGFEVCRRLREWSQVPIIILSARDGETDKLRCLEIGADDYLTKPFSLNELLSRLKVVLRRSQKYPYAAVSSRFGDGKLEIDFDRQLVLLSGKEIQLTVTEYRILVFLAGNAGRIVAPEFILEKVWGQKFLHNNRLLWVNISRLRRKLNCEKGRNGYVQTRPGLGYYLQEQVFK
jgi:two-component system, OmpR family, KDP operon response regulator KdpE